MESVLVIRRRDLFARSTPHGFLPLAPEAVESTLALIAERGFFVERAAAETEPEWKQVIPYCLLRRDDELLAMARLSGGGEARLRGRRSIGVGGHINPDDGSSPGHRFWSGLEREVQEEVAMAPGWRAVPLGLINDDTTEVGAVHVGLVCGIRVPPGSVTLRETDKLVGRFEPLAELRKSCEDPDTWETWSSLVLVRATTWLTRF